MKIPVLMLFLPIVLVLACAKTSDSGATGWGLKFVAHSSTTLSVCWENRSKSDLRLKPYRAELSQFVKSEFGRTKLSLVGWGDCANPRGGEEIRITWWDEGEAELGNLGRSKIGKGLSPYPSDLYLLPQIVPSSVKSAPTLALNGHSFSFFEQKKSLSFAKAEFKSTLLHELGHAVGMLHEHAHPGNSGFCTPNNENFRVHVELWKNFDAKAILDSAIGTKSYDPRSIMNYCYLDAMSGTAVGLSQGDVGTINALYTGTLTQPVAQPAIQPSPKPMLQQPAKLPPTGESSEPNIPKPAPGYAKSAPMGACQAVVNVNDFLPQYVDVEGSPGFVCEDIMNLGYSPVIICTSAFDINSCTPTIFEYVNGQFVKSRKL